MNKYNLRIIDYIICSSLVIYLLYKTCIERKIVNIVGIVNRFSDIPNTTTSEETSEETSEKILTATPTPTPTAKPTLTPFVIPTAIPTAKPSAKPTAKPTVTPEVTTMSIPTDIGQKCDGGTNLVTYCMNYNGCCSSNNIANNSCFCNHSFVMNCKNEYDNCTENDCQDKLKKCCMTYNNINIESNNFKKPIKQDQKSKIICTVNSSNMEQKCMELCQTNTNCKAYSTNDINCILFSDIDPLPNNANYKTKTNYFIKI